MKRCVTLGAVMLATILGTLGFSSFAEACWGCRRSCNTCYSSPVYTFYSAPTPVYYQPYQPCNSCQSAYYAAPAYAVPVTAYYAPTYAPVYAPAVIPTAYQVPYEERVKVRVDVPWGRDYKYDYARTGNYVRVRERY